MTKYSICEFQDGNGKRWYQIKVHCRWLSPYFYGATTYANYDTPARWREPTRYFVYESAEATVKKLIESEKSKIIQLIDCKDYE